MVLVITTSNIGLGLRVVGGRVWLVGCLRFDLGIGKVHMVLRRGHLRQVMVDLDVGRHSGRLAHWLRLWVPRELSDLESGKFFLPALDKVSIDSIRNKVAKRSCRGRELSHDKTMPCLGAVGLAWRGRRLRRRL